MKHPVYFCFLEEFENVKRTLYLKPTVSELFAILFKNWQMQNFFVSKGHYLPISSPKNFFIWNKTPSLYFITSSFLKL